MVQRPVTFWRWRPATIVIDGPGGVRRVSLEKPFAVVGSLAAADVRLQGPEIHRRELLLIAAEEGVFAVPLCQGGAGPEHGQWFSARRPMRIGAYQLGLEGPAADNAREPDDSLQWATDEPGWDRRGSLDDARWRIEVYAGNHPIGRFRLARRITLIGRHAPSSILLSSRSVSSCHCAVLCLDEQVWAIDLHSVNGTAINGRRVDATLWPPDAELEVGRVRLRLRRSGDGGSDSSASSSRLDWDDASVDLTPIPESELGLDEAQGPAEKAVAEQAVPASEEPGPEIKTSDAAIEQSGMGTEAAPPPDQPELEARQAELERREQELARREGDLAEKQRKLAVEHEQTQRRADELDQLHAELQEAQRRLEEERQRILQQQAAVDEQHTTAQSRAEELKQRAMELARWESALKDRQQAIDQREEQLDQREQGLAEQQRQLASRAEGIDRREEALRQRQSQLEDEVRQLAQEKGRLEEQAAANGERESEWVRRQSALDRREKELDKRAAEIEQRFAAVEASAERESEELQRRMGDVEKRERDLEEQRRQLHKRQEELQQRDAELQSRQQQIEEEQKRWSQQQADEQAVAQQRQADLERREDRIRQHESRLEQAQEAQRKERETWEKEFCELQARHEERAERLNRLLAQTQARQEELDNRRHAFDRRERELAERANRLETDAPKEQAEARSETDKSPLPSPAPADKRSPGEPAPKAEPTVPREESPPAGRGKQPAAASSQPRQAYRGGEMPATIPRLPRRRSRGLMLKTTSVAASVVLGILTYHIAGQWIPQRYETAARIEFSATRGLPAVRDGFGPPNSGAEQQPRILPHQTALLQNALSEPGVTDAPIFANIEDPLTWLADNLQVYAPEGTPFMRLRLEGADPSTAEVVLSRIATDYLTRLQSIAEQRAEAFLAQCRQDLAETTDGLDAIETQLAELEKQFETTNPYQLELQQQLLQQQASATRTELSELSLDRQSKAERLRRARPYTDGEEVAVTEDEIRTALAEDTEALQLLASEELLLEKLAEAGAQPTSNGNNSAQDGNTAHRAASGSSTDGASVAELRSQLAAVREKLAPLKEQARKAIAQRVRSEAEVEAEVLAGELETITQRQTEAQRELETYETQAAELEQAAAQLRQLIDQRRAIEQEVRSAETAVAEAQQYAEALRGESQAVVNVESRPVAVTQRRVVRGFVGAGAALSLLLICGLLWLWQVRRQRRPLFVEQDWQPRAARFRRFSQQTP